MRVVEEFRRHVGAEPQAVGAAPGRVNLIGEHLDYNGGRALPIALTCRTRVAVAARSDGRLVVRSLQRPDQVDLDVTTLGPATAKEAGWAGYVAGVVWALDLGGRGYDVVVDGGVPVGSGLSSSAALECATAVALCEVTGASPRTDAVVGACVRAENEYVGAGTGALDQTVVLLARPGHALLLDFGSGTRTQVPWSPPGELVVIDTRASHDLADGAYAERRRACERAAAALGVGALAEADEEDLAGLTEPELVRRARHVLSENARVSRALTEIQRNGWTELGRLMTQSHLSLRDDFEVSCAELDTAVEAALEAGAWGARMTGGGFGGSAIALAAPGDGDAVREAVTAAFAEAGFAAPAFLDGTAGGPARPVSPPWG